MIKKQDFLKVLKFNGKKILKFKILNHFSKKINLIKKFKTYFYISIAIGNLYIIIKYFEKI